MKTPNNTVTIDGGERQEIFSTEVNNFDPYQTFVVRIEYEPFPSYEEAFDDLRRKGFHPLGLAELQKTCDLIEKLQKQIHAQAKGVKVLKLREIATDNLKRLMGLFGKSCFLAENNILVPTHGMVTYIGSLITEINPRLQDVLNWYPYIYFTGISAYPRLEALQPEYFYRDVACIKL